MTSKEKAFQKKVYEDYRKKGYGKERSAHIARAVVYGPRKPKKKVARRKRSWWDF
jgi:hypothetical protein